MDFKANFPKKKKRRGRPKSLLINELAMRWRNKDPLKRRSARNYMYLENALKALSPDQALYDFIFNDKRQKRTILFELGKMKKAENIVPVATSIREVMSEDSNAKSRDAVQWIKYLRKKYSLE